MKTLRPESVALYLVVGLAMGALPASAAQPKLPPSPVKLSSAQVQKDAMTPSATPGNTVLIATTYSAGDNAATLSAGGFTAADMPKTLTCPNDGGNCRIEAVQHAQVSGGTTATDSWAICTYVDGTPMSKPSCPYLGYISQTFYSTGSFGQNQIAVTPGAHTVQTYVFSSDGGTLDNYEFTYHLYH